MSDVVVELDLSRVGGVVEAETSDESRADRLPIEVGVCDDVSVEVANCAVEFSERFEIF